MRQTWQSLIGPSQTVKRPTYSELLARGLFEQHLESLGLKFDTYRGADPPDWFIDLGDRGVVIEVSELHKQIRMGGGRIPVCSIIKPLQNEVSRHLRPASASGDVEVRLIQGPISGNFKRRIADLMKPSREDVPVSPLIGISNSLRCGDGASPHQNLTAVVKDAVGKVFEEKHSALSEFRQHESTEVVLILVSCLGTTIDSAVVRENWLELDRNSPSVDGLYLVEDNQLLELYSGASK